MEKLEAVAIAQYVLQNKRQVTISQLGFLSCDVWITVRSFSTVMSTVDAKLIAAM